MVCLYFVMFRFFVTKIVYREHPENETGGIFCIRISKEETDKTWID